MRAMVRRSVRDIRTAPASLPAEPPADPIVVATRAVVDDLVASTYASSELMLEVAPAYLSDEQAADVLALLCDQIGEDPQAWVGRPPPRDVRRPPRPSRHRPVTAAGVRHARAIPGRQAG
ncbi:hypothetical protein [Streptomyces goshikiensis]|uniref:hypothetical protein n=1 Tax=Streptomyces goshikiensis TaxID=1942 RepID=UPI0036484684